MVTRVSTVDNYASVLANLMAAQQRQLEAGARVATQKNGDDLKSFSRQAELLTAMKSVDTRLVGYLDQNTLIADRLTTQDSAINQVADAVKAARKAIADALAAGDATNLMNEIQGQLSKAVGAMNTRYNGTFLFAGGAINDQPVTVTQLSDLTAGPAISTFFQNDTFKAKAQIDDATTVNVGVLASDIGMAVLTAFQGVQAFEEGPDGSLGGVITPAQRDFLESQLAAWDSVHTGVINIAAQNGMVQQRVDSVKTDIKTRQNTLRDMMANITDADMAQASADLQLANLSFRAAAEVFQTLKDSSLLSILRP